MKIAITGATGFVGSHLVERLHGEGKRVLVLTRNAASTQKVFPSAAFHNVEIVTYSTTSGSWQNAIAT